MITVFLAISVFLINIPFGYWRKSVKKFSIKWFLSIHIPVGISIGLRYWAKIDFKWSILILFILVFIIGQYAGRLVYAQRLKIRQRNQIVNSQEVSV